MQVVSVTMKGFLRLYQNALNRRPMTMQVVQTGLLMGAGDVISQTLIEKRNFSNLDVKRTIQFSSIGVFLIGPALTVWYGVLNKYVGSAGRSVALKKVCMDQFIFAPSFLVVVLGAVGTLQGKTYSQVKSDVEANYLDVLKTNYIIWPWVQLVNFYYVPLNYQVLLVQSVAILWNTYLSWKTNKKRVYD